jgi:hypothetical protein
MVVGRNQMLPSNDPGVVNLLMCHHPLDWLHDRDALRDSLKARTTAARLRFAQADWEASPVVDAEPFQCLMLGLPKAGKTTFLAALWHVLKPGEIPGSLLMGPREGDQEYLNRTPRASNSRHFARNRSRVVSDG